MFYFDFSGTFARWHLFADAAFLTVWLSFVAIVLGMIVGLLGAAARLSSVKPLRIVAASYVELIRNTPFLVQIYIIYFGLPTVGVRFSPLTAAVLSLTVYAGAYVTEIVRAGIQTIPKGQIEAARALGLSRYRIFRHVIMLPAMATIYPALASQFILVMLASSVASTISTPELTAIANEVQGMTFRSFEAFLVVAAIYLALTAVFRALFTTIDRFAFTFKHVGH